MLPTRMELGPIGVPSVKFRSCIAVPVSLKILASFARMAPLLVMILSQMHQLMNLMMLH